MQPDLTPLVQLVHYMPLAVIAAGLLLLLWSQRRALASLLRRGASDDEESADENDEDAAAHQAYACLRRLLDEVEDCPKATDALQLVVLPALVSGVDSPHYRVTWEAKS